MTILKPSLESMMSVFHDSTDSGDVTSSRRFIVQGTEVEVIKAIQQYTPFVYFASHPIASVNQAGEMIKTLTK